MKKRIIKGMSVSYDIRRYGKNGVAFYWVYTIDELNAPSHDPFCGQKDFLRFLSMYKQTRDWDTAYRLSTTN